MSMGGVMRKLTRPAPASAGPSRAPSVGRISVVAKAANVAQLKALRTDLATYIQSKSCNPIVIRLAWHDSGTFDKNQTVWPKTGGATASIRFMPESGHGANAGLQIARDLLEGFKKTYPEVSYSDIYQMASAVAVEIAGGPKIPMRYGRVDAASPEDCVKEGNLPAAAAPFHVGTDAASHLRIIFNRMGFSDQEIVALSGAHTLGRARPDRGYAPAKAVTKYTTAEPGNPGGDGKGTVGSPGGQSWTPDWLVFNNSYFTEVKAKRDSELLVLPTDAVIFEDERFRPFAERYAESEELFFAEYAVAHAKLSELGVKWESNAPVMI